MSYANGIKVKPISRNDIKRLVRKVRKKAEAENLWEFPVIVFLELVLPIIFPKFHYEIIPNDELSGKYAETFPEEYFIRIREDVYLDANNGNGRARFTIAHEIGHLILHRFCILGLARNDGEVPMKCYENSEWQADAFAGELLALSYLIKGHTPEYIKEKCKISFTAAKIQLQHA